MFSDPGQYSISVQVRDSQSQTFSSTSVTVLNQIISDPDSNGSGNYSKSSQLACDVNTGTVWSVNPDNNTVTAISAEHSETTGEYEVGDTPKGVALSSSGEVWVINRGSDSVTVLNQSGDIVSTIDLTYGSAPWGIAMSNDGLTAYLSLYGSGEIAAVDTRSYSILNRTQVGSTPAALALSPDGSKLLATRFISGENWGEIYQLNTSDMSLQGTIRLIKDYGADDFQNGRGVPNYLAAVTFSPDGERAFVVGKKDNTDRSPILWRRINANTDLDDDNTVRTVMATIDMRPELGEDQYDLRLDFDNAESPSGVQISPNGEYLFVSLQGNNSVVALDVINHRVGELANITAHLTTELAPQGLCFDDTNKKLFVKNFLSRSVTSLDMEAFIENGNNNPASSHINTVSNERLDDAVLRGKQIFYNASDERMSAEGYIACSTCHVDGGHDGRTWDFTGRGEGLRNTTTLLGKGGNRFGNLHWSANFDEIHDFENDIRNAFLGAGFLSDSEFEDTSDTLGLPKEGLDDDLDALATYVGSLGKHSIPRSPHRSSNGVLTAQGAIGQDLFIAQNCHSCHTGSAFTDGQLHNVGSTRAYSGGRLNGELPGIKTPTLLGVFASAPYMHDGSAKTITDVFTTVGGDIYQAEDASLSAGAPVMGHEYLRESNGASIRAQNGNLLTFNGIDGGAGGTSFIRFRYAGVESQNDRVVNIQVNNTNYSKQLEYTPPLDWRRGNHAESSAVEVSLNPGTNNTIVMSYPGGEPGYFITIDDLTVSTSNHVEQADAHTRVNTLSTSNKASLVQYILQLDGTDAPEDNESLGIVSIGADPEPNEPAPEPPAVTPQPDPAPEPPVDTPTPDPATESIQPNSGGLFPENGGGSTSIYLVLLLAGALGKRRFNR